MPAPARLLDTLSACLPDLRMVAPQSSWEWGRPRPDSERYRLDDPECREVKRVLIGIEDEHGTMHVLHAGNFEKYSLVQIARIPAAEKAYRENRAAREVEREKYERENPFACQVKQCQKRFRTFAGLRQHCALKARPNPDGWQERIAAHAKALEALRG